jgi:hypothetical protein
MHMQQFPSMQPSERAFYWCSGVNYCAMRREGWWERSDSGKFNANECSSVISTHPLEVTQHNASPPVDLFHFISLSKFNGCLEKKRMHLTHFPAQREKVRGQIGHTRLLCCLADVQVTAPACQRNHSTWSASRRVSEKKSGHCRGFPWCAMSTWSAKSKKGFSRVNKA